VLFEGLAFLRGVARELDNLLTAATLCASPEPHTKIRLQLPPSLHPNLESWDASLRLDLSNREDEPHPMLALAHHAYHQIAAFGCSSVGAVKGELAHANIIPLFWD
jgi:hypothetical protein